MVDNLTELLQPIADWFASFGIPDIVIHWGHPLMMGIVVFVVGSYVGFSGWRSRQLKDSDRDEVEAGSVLSWCAFPSCGSRSGVAPLSGRSNFDQAMINKANHRKMAPFLFIFLALGYTGGILSLVMQGQNILASNHFWTGSVVLVLLTINAILSATGFMGNKSLLRTIHAYVGSLALAILLFHAVLGLKLGLSI